MPNMQPMQPKKPEGGEIPKGRAWWALVIGFSVAIAALFYGLWLVRPF